MTADTRLKLRRTTALALVIFFLGTWLAGVPIYVNGIFNDIDLTLSLIFLDGWGPEGVAMTAAASEALGFGVTMPAWVWLAIEVVLVATFAGGGLFIALRTQDAFGTYVGVALVLVGTRIAGPVASGTQIFAPWTQPWNEFLSGLAVIAFASLVYLLPNGRFVPRWMRWAVPLILTLTIGDLIVVTFLGIPDNDLRNFIFWVMPVAIGLLTQIYRYARVATPEERQQIKWIIVAFSGFVIIAGGSSLFLPEAIDYAPPESPRHLSTFLLAHGFLTPATVILVIGIAISVVRYRLWAIDVIIRRTLIYGVLTALLAGVYFGGVTLLQAAFSTVTGTNNTLAVVISTLAIAALFRPAQTRVQRVIDRRLYRQSYDATRILSDFAEAVRDEIDVEDVEAALLQAVGETMQPESVGLWLRDTGEGV